MCIRDSYCHEPVHCGSASLRINREKLSFFRGFMYRYKYHSALFIYFVQSCARDVLHNLLAFLGFDLSYLPQLWDRNFRPKSPSQRRCSNPIARATGCMTSWRVVYVGEYYTSTLLLLTAATSPSTTASTKVFNCCLRRRLASLCPSSVHAQVGIIQHLFV